MRSWISSEMVKLELARGPAGVPALIPGPLWRLIPDSDPGSPIPGPCKEYIYLENTMCGMKRQVDVEMIMHDGDFRIDRSAPRWFETYSGNYRQRIFVQCVRSFTFDYTCPSILPAGALGLWPVHPP
jgi:hypothetical protein